MNLHLYISKNYQLFAPLALTILLCTASPLQLDAALTSEMTPSQVSPAPIGTVINWTVQASDSNTGVLWYQFSTRGLKGDFHVVKDFSPSNTLDWTEIDSEGLYVIEASVRNMNTGETVSTSVTYELDSRVTNTRPVINPTNHPLVFLYSAPPCPAGSKIRVVFWSSMSDVQVTPAQPCRPGLSRNFYLAGLHPQETYLAQHWITGFRVGAGPVLSLTAGALPNSVGGMPLVAQKVLQNNPRIESEAVLLQGPVNGSPVATDLNGKIIWYYPDTLRFLTRPDSNGLFFGIHQNPGTDPSGSLLREFDLTGRTVLETNAAAVNLQLAALGKRSIGVFHHEARRLANGNILTLATVEQILSGVQGPLPVDIIGDMVIVLDSNLQVVWTWDAFDYLDVTRAAVLGETCKTGGCASNFLSTNGNDWTHGNALQETPDGNLLFSARHQDWLIKIDYSNGRGDGHVIWRMGKDGDFVFESSDPYPWFSHQHDANFLKDNATLLVFDNGNTRKSTDPSANSRGQVLIVDEQHRVVRFALNKDLGVFSTALGSAQRLANGNYHFDAGWLSGNQAISYEVDGRGNIVRENQAATVEYRTFRMCDLYTPD